VYIAVTAYVLYRTMADRQKSDTGLLAALFYIIFGSTLQASQSFTAEHLLGLPFALLLHVVLNPRPSWRQAAAVLALFAVCTMLVPTFICMVPPIALLYRPLYQPPLRKGLRLRVLLRNGAWPVMVRSAMLLSAAGAGYLLFYLLYAAFGQGHYYLVSVLDAWNYLSGGRYDSSLLFFRQYFSKLLGSQQWLIAVFVLCFLTKAALSVFQQQWRFDRWLHGLLLLGIGAAYMVYFRGSSKALFLFYFLQVLPVYALIMAYSLKFNLADLRWFVWAVSLVGLNHTTEVVQNSYPSFLSYLRGNNSYNEYVYGDRLYRVAQVMSTFPLKGESIVVCGEDDMLYILTGAENPRFFLFPFYPYNFGLHRVLGHDFANLYRVVADKAPLYIVGREGDALTNRGFGELGDLLARNYAQVANVDGTVIYLRRDKLKNIFQN
jgi:hypothetical protein